MGKELIQEALLTLEDVKKTVESAAKVVISEKVNKRVNEEIDRLFEEDEAVMGEKKEDEVVKTEEKKDKEVDLEEILGMGTEEKKDHKEPDGDECKVDDFTDVEPVEEKKEKVDGEEEEEEEVPNDEELEEVYEMIMKEMTVGGLPKDVTDTEKATGKVKEKNWDEADVEGKNKTFTVKESKMLKRLLAVHRNTLAESKKKDMVIAKLVREMKGINLYNTRLIYASKVLGESTLTNTDRKRVLAMFDKAKSINECEAIYNSFTSAFSMSKARLNESVSRKIAGLNKTVLKESGKGNDSEDADLSRMGKLAGLTSDEE